MALLESVPNVSEGRDAAVVAALADGIRERGARAARRARRCRPPPGASSRSSVGDAALEDGLVAGIARGARPHRPAPHTSASTRASARRTSSRSSPLARAMTRRARRRRRVVVAERVGTELALPVFLYGELGAGRRPAFFRRGGPTSSSGGSTPASWRPTSGRPRLDAAARGRCSSGVARLRWSPSTSTLDGPLEVATRGRRGGAGVVGRPARRAGARPAARRRDRSRCRRTCRPRRHGTARARGADRGRGSARAAWRCAGGELVGLVPAAVVAAALRPRRESSRPLDDEACRPSGLAAAAQALRLARLEPDRVLEWHVRGWRADAVRRAARGRRRAVVRLGARTAARSRASQSPRYRDSREPRSPMRGRGRGAWVGAGPPVRGSHATVVVDRPDLDSRACRTRSS